MDRAIDEIQVDVFPHTQIPFPAGVMNISITSKYWIDLLAEKFLESCPIAMAIQARCPMEAESKTSHMLGPVGILAKVLEMREISSNHYVFTFLGLRRIQFLNLMPNLQGVWRAVALVHSKDRHKPVPKELLSTANLLRATLHDQEMLSKFKNLQFEDSGWVANRWCELLPLSTQEKESLLMETDPQYRLSEVSKFLSQAGFS